MIVIVVVAVVAVLGLVVVLASGGDDDSDSGDGGVASGGGGDIEQFAATLASAIDQQDTDTLSAMSCPDASGSVQAAIESVAMTEGAELAGAEAAGDGYLVTVDITVEGQPVPYGMTVVDQDEGLCVQDVAAGGVGGGGSGEVGAPGDAGSEASSSEGSEGSDGSEGAAPGGGGSTAEEGEEFVATFIGEVNQGDEETALEMMCPDASSSGDVSDAIAGDPILEVDWDTAESDPTYVGADLAGTLDGEPLSFGSLSAFYEEDWCIYTFSVS